MRKQEFLTELEKQLRRLSPSDTENAVSYYSGIIDGRIERGMSEDEAVSAFGGADDVALRYISAGRVSQKHIISTKIKSLPTFSRLFFSTLVMLASFSVIAAYWVIIASVYAVVSVILLCGAAGFFGGIVMCFISTLPVGLCTVGAGTVLFSLSLLLVGPVRALTKVATSFTGIISAKLRGLLTREALSV